MSFKLRYLASVLALSSLLAACGGQEKSAAGDASPASETEAASQDRPRKPFLPLHRPRPKTKTF